MLKKLKPKVFSEEGRKALSKSVRTQEVVKGTPKSTDPVNFPVFDIPVNAKALIYVPNHVVQNEEGVATLRMDTPLIHSITDGNRYLYYRCISGLTVDGYSGSCPLCDGVNDCWDLANFIIEEKCRQRGLNPDDKENKDVKGIRSDAFSDRVLKDANRKFVFPIVVFETLNNDGKTLVRDSQNQIKYKIMWYEISESMYNDKWVKAFETMEEEPTHPGGHCFVLNYTYTPKNGEPNKRDSARNLVVGPKKMKGLDQIAPQLDKLTESWTPEKAQETVISNIFYEEEDLQELTDSLLEPVRMRLDIYRSSSDAGDESNAVGIADNGGVFNLEKKEDDPIPVQGMETDADDEDDSGFEMSN